MEKNEITEYIDHFFKKAQEKGSIKAFSFVYGALNKKFGPGTKDKYQKYMDELKEQIVKKPQIKKIEEKPKNISGESDIFGDSQEEKKIEEQQQEEELKLDTSDYVNEANTKKE